MLSFKQFQFRQVGSIKEGGNAVPDVGPINQENAMATYNKVLEELLPKLKLKKEHAASLGSTGKKAPGDTSGDIDIALSATELLKKNNIDTYDDIMGMVVQVVEKTGYDFKDMRGLGIVSIAYPIENVDGKQEGEKVQVDLMLVKNLEHAKWGFYSPSYLESELKGIYRNYLIIGIAKFIGIEVTEKDKETQEPITWKRLFWHMKDGLQKGVQTRISPKTGKVVKSRKTIEKSDITDSPDDIVKFLFGDKYKAKDILTFDQALSAILDPSFPFKEHRKTILTFASEELQQRGYPIPERLDKHVA